MAEEKVLAEGLRKFAPHQNAPDFVKGSLVISVNKFFAFVKAHPEFLTEYQGEKQIKLQELESRDGKPYFTVDTYGTAAQPANTPKNTQSSPAREKFKETLTKASNSQVIDLDDDTLPF